MDQQIVSKEILTDAIREAISHVNRNLYEWTIGNKNQRNLTISHTEVVALVRNWIVRSLRKVIGNRDADMIFRGIYVNVDTENNYLTSIHLSVSGEYCKHYTIIREILNSMKYSLLKYKPSDYLSEGMSSKKEGFDPYFSISFSAIDSIKF